MDIVHPDIDRIERTGYADKEYLDYEEEMDHESSEMGD